MSLLRPILLILALTALFVLAAPIGTQPAVAARDDLASASATASDQETR